MMDSISNFIGLLLKGDFFLIFLIVMMVIIIGVIVYLVRLQITDSSYDRDEDDDEVEDEEDTIMAIQNTLEDKNPVIKEEKKEVEDINDIDFNDYEDEDEVIKELSKEIDDSVLAINKDEEVEEVYKEEYNSSKDNEDEERELVFENPRRHIEQSRFNFDTETKDEIKSFEDEQEETAIISASELESRINEMKATGEFEEHERRIEEYEKEQENKAIISYDELLKRASANVLSYESEEEMGGIRVSKVDTSNMESIVETNEKPYYKEEAFLEAMKEFRRAL